MTSDIYPNTATETDNTDAPTPKLTPRVFVREVPPPELDE